MEKISDANPDLVTLDVAMPGMGGQEALRALLRWKPALKVVMLSAYTREGRSGDHRGTGCRGGRLHRQDQLQPRGSGHAAPTGDRQAADLGAEGLTGGNARGDQGGRRRSGCEPGGGGTLRALRDRRLDRWSAALQGILERLPATFPMPVAIVQHMPAGFTQPFAERLDRLSQLKVGEAVDGDRLRPGRVLVAPAGRHLRITPGLSVSLGAEVEDGKHVPSVDVAMQSAARARPGRVLGILLTGMGQDGAEGMAAIRASGGFTIGESEASCVVYGMSRAAEMRGAVDCLLPYRRSSRFWRAWGRVSESLARAPFGCASGQAPGAKQSRGLQPHSSSQRSSHSGFIRSINSTFRRRDPALICFSRAIAHVRVQKDLVQHEVATMVPLSKPTALPRSGLPGTLRRCSISD